MINTEHKLTKTELKKNGLLKLIERWQQLCLDLYFDEYDKNINCAIRLFKNIYVDRNIEGDFNFNFNKFDWHYESLKDKLPVLCILSVILEYYKEAIPSYAIDVHIEKTATVRQLENFEVLRRGISILQELEEKSKLAKECNYLADITKSYVYLDADVDPSIAIVAMESLYKLLQNARKDAAEEKLRELFPQHNTYINGTIHNSGTITGDLYNPKYNK